MSKNIQWQGGAEFNISAERLFNYMSDFTSTRSWDPNVVDARLITSPPIGEGSVFEIDFKMGISTTTIEYTVTEFEPNTLIRMKGQSGQFEIEDTITIEAINNDQNSCRMTYALDINLSKKSSIAEKFGSKLVARYAEKSLKNLQRTFVGESAKVKQYPAWLDKALIPGALEFTKLGYYQQKKNFYGYPLRETKQRVLLTGATSGIGREMAIELARSGAELILPARNQDKLDELVSHLQARFNTKCHKYTADFSSIAQTKTLAKNILQDFDSLDCLINNAGELIQERKVTDEGFEYNMSVLLLSPFVLTHELLPLLQKSSKNSLNPSKVINTLSGGLYAQGFPLDDVNFEKGTFDGSKAYARAKRGLLDSMQHWSRAIDKRKVVFHGFHPGWSNTPGVEKSLPGFYKVMKSSLRTPYQGADTAIWLALNPVASHCSGLFWLDRRSHTTGIFPGTKSDIVKQEAVFQLLEGLTDVGSQTNDAEPTSEGKRSASR